MFLTIDIGNTNTVFALFGEGQDVPDTSHVWRCETVRSRTADEYAVFLNQLLTLRGIAWGTINEAIICSVVPEADFHIRQFCAIYLKREPLFVTAANAGIEMDVERPSEIGADRLVNAVAICAYYTYPAIVIDFGTATTFDVVDAQGRYAGGVIAPGINLSIAALQKAASKLPGVAVARPPRVIGRETVGAMQSGIYWGYIGLIEGITARIRDEMGMDVFVLATGGLAPLFAESANIINQVDDELTLKGLRVIRQQVKR